MVKSNKKTHIILFFKNKPIIFAPILKVNHTLMKKLLLFLTALTLLLTSCGNSQNSGAEEPCDSIISSDLAFYRLHGKVHKVTYMEIGLEYEFDEQGNLISFLNHDPFIEEPIMETDTLGNRTEYSSFKKNQDGQIAQIIGTESVNTYTWENGLVVADEGSGNGLTWKCSYEHDANGNCIYQHAIYYDVFNKTESSGTTTYTFIVKDEHGNWLERSEKYIPDVATATNKETAPYKQTRTITYYE